MSGLALPRHHVENLLAIYAALADSTDAIVNVLADAIVSFDGAEPVSGRGQIVALLSTTTHRTIFFHDGSPPTCEVAGRAVPA